ncbi:S8 family serine peptidase [Solitalea koreensis]|uniref:Por secretion system C-terminal sorting domain-containing protein n=1 Tax=Solitalea koreensis TaxID=543615 RepID=A0A521AMC5_9SPHI|nr:S8 family serine peptidase [Solitalea koreensis]SMO35949.1 Por secretion system C-terminal sorting domain-containing protein [Solitalea koreensis]
MRKLFFPFVLVLFLVHGSQVVYSQNYKEISRTQKKVLTKLSDKLKDNYKLNHERVLALAKEKKWEVFKVNKDGSIMGLQGVDSKGYPIYLITNNLSSAATLQTDALWPGGSTGFNLKGSKSSLAGKIAIWDGSQVLGTHQEFAGRIKNGDNTSSYESHTTHVAGTLIASGINPSAKGMAFAAPDLYSYDFFNDDAEMAKAAADRGLLLSNHSYGNIAGWRFNSDRAGTNQDPQWEWWGQEGQFEDYKFGSYTSFATNWDKIAFNAPYYLIVKSAGNNRNQTGPNIGQAYYQRNDQGTFKLVNQRVAGAISNNDSYDILSTTSNAKNILVVGAIQPLTNGKYNQPSDVILAPFSSWGPTDDGRIKPDVVSLGINVLSTSSAANDAYAIMDGTSMAAPAVTGTALLLQEHYSNLNNNNFMRSATLKGLIIHTADEAGNAPGPDYQNGWGLVNAKRAALLISNNNNQGSLIQERSLNQGEKYQFQVIASGTEPLAATIAWTDPDATPTADGIVNSKDLKLINDLDIRITSANNTFAPWILDPANPANPATTGDNFRDNIEKIFIAASQPGEVYTITVSHKGTLKNGKQDYSIIVSGVGGKSYCTSAGLSPTGSRITNVFMGRINNNTAGLCTGYSNFSNLSTSIEPSQVLPLSITTGNCGSANPSIVKVFVDWNSNGSFDDAGELVSTNPNIAPGSTINTTITAPNNITIGKTVRMRIILQEGTDPNSVISCGSYASGETEDYAIAIVPPSNDIAVTALVNPDNNSCQNNNQNVTVRITNEGTLTQSNIPVSTVLSDATGALKTFTGIIAGPLSRGAAINFTFPETFSSIGGHNYTFTTTANLSGDQIGSNNTLIQTVVTNPVPSPPLLSAAICDDVPGNVLLQASTTSGTTFWYDSPTATNPIAAGNKAMTTTNATVLYGALNDFSGSVGPVNKSVFGFTGSAYNQFSPSVKITALAPIELEKARLYIGHSGIINFSVTNEKTGEEVSSVSLNVTATRKPEALGAQLVDPTDTGTVYNLNLKIPVPGNYLINISYDKDATILRNNANVNGYPFQISGVMSITGNTASTGPLNYYYYFYDMKVKALGCISPREAVSVNKPLITLVNGELVSNQLGNNQWYLNGRLIEKATDSHYKPEHSGTYQVKVEGECTSSSNEINYTRPDIPSNIDMKLFPVPAADLFTLQFNAWETSNLEVRILDINGKVILRETGENFSGLYSKTYRLDDYATGVYLVDVKINTKDYIQKFTVVK